MDTHIRCNHIANEYKNANEDRRNEIATAIYEQYSGLAYRQFSKNNYGYDADEHTSLLYICIAEKLGTYDADKGDVWGWLMTTYHSYVQQQWRYNGSTVHIPVEQKSNYENHMVSAHAPINDDGGTILDILGEDCDNIEAFEHRETIEYLKKECLNRFPKYTDIVDQMFEGKEYGDLKETHGKSAWKKIDRIKDYLNKLDDKM